jgi:dTDP-4-amino-4,6-dideoxygalactose transaminase
MFVDGAPPGSLGISVQHLLQSCMKAMMDRNGQTREGFAVRSWFRERFPRQPHVYFGLSGTTLLHEALKAQTRTSVVLPAFICSDLSAAAVRAGKRVIHIDADRHTQLPDRAQLETYLASQDTSDAVLLVDHSFGYPFPDLACLRRRFPKLLVIEDCARALGVQIRGQLPGVWSDWILFSMYKTIPGSSNGAVLLTNMPIPMRDQHRVPVTIRERVATIGPLRFMYHELQRRTPSDFRPRISDLGNFPQWTPAYGLPSRLCMARFAAELKDLEIRASMRSSNANELTDSLCRAGIECIKPAERCQSAGHFVSFRTPSRHARNELLARLHRKGLFVARTWDLVPAHYHSFLETFPSGHTNSEHLADHMGHIRVGLYLSSRRRRRLVEEIRDFFKSGHKAI